MNERTRALWQRNATFIAAALLHIGLLLLVLPLLTNRSEPPADAPVDVAMMPPVHWPKPRPKPAPRPAKVNESASQTQFQPVPRVARISQTRIRITPPTPELLTPLPASASPSTTGTSSNGSGNGSAGTGNGSLEGNDYLRRLKAYIDARKGRARHREPYDTDVVLVLDQDGMLTDIRLVGSSGDSSVDNEIIAQLKQMSPFPKPPAILFSPTKLLLPVADKWIFPRP